jgi:transposase-like protein
MSMTKNQTKREKWGAIVAEFKASGLSIRKWAMERGIRPRQLCYWIHRIEGRTQRKVSAAKPSFVEVKVVESQAPTKMAEPLVFMREAELEAPASGISIRIGEAVIEVRSGFDPEVLADVLRVVQTC